MRPLRALVYDCDGVLFDSRRANLAYYNQILTELGERPVLEEETERALLCHTGSTPQVLRHLLGSERAAEGLRVAAQVDYRPFLAWMTPEPGLLVSLRQLVGRLPLAIATNRQRTMGQILQHFELTEFFRCVTTSSDVQRPKPFPDMLWHTAQLLGCALDEMLYVGDSLLDQQAAQAAGVPFVAYRWAGEGRRIEHHADLVGLVAQLCDGS